MNFIIPLLCLFSLVFTISNENVNFQYIYVLPISLLIFFFLERITVTKIRKSFVYYIFYIQAIIRYTIIPIGIANNFDVGNGNITIYGNLAVFLMILELMYCYIVFLVSSNIFNFTQFKQAKKLILVKKSYLTFAFIFVLFLIIFSSGYLSKVNMIWNLNKYIIESQSGNLDDENINSIGGLLFKPFKIITLLLIATYIISSNKIKENYKFYLLVGLILLMSLFIVGSSRMSIITFIIPYYIIISNIFGNKYKKKLTIYLGVIIIPIIIFTSINKFTRVDREVNVETILSISSLNAYFAGPGNMAIGIESFENLKEKEYASFLFNDLFQNVPLVSKLTNPLKKSNYVFNREIYGHSYWQTQIVPLNISALYHFNYFGFGIYTSLFLFLAFYMNSIAINENNIVYKYVFLSIALSLSMIFMLNIGSMIVTIIRSFIFIYFPFFIINNLNRIK